jgi:hypothetical protein
LSYGPVHTSTPEPRPLSPLPGLFPVLFQPECAAEAEFVICDQTIEKRHISFHLAVMKWFSDFSISCWRGSLSIARISALRRMAHYLKPVHKSGDAKCPIGGY